MQKAHYSNALALDIGDVRIGVARGSSVARLAEGLTTLIVDGTEIDRLKELVAEHDIDLLVIGVPRNQEGELTEQTKKTFVKAEQLAEELHLPMVFQDESLTSIAAEKLLKQSGEAYDKPDIDRVAAQLILQDFLDQGE